MSDDGKGRMVPYEAPTETPNKPARYWAGALSEDCQICGNPFGSTMIDGATARGWANMCKSCHDMYGKGLGTGRGQKYERERYTDPNGATSNRWRKVEG